MKAWVSIPTWWYRAEDQEGGLQRLKGGAHAGDSQAALRVLIGAALVQPRLAPYEVMASLSLLEEITDLSRPTVIKGIEAAQTFGLIRHFKGGPRQASRIQLVSPEAEAGKPGGWAKMPGKLVMTAVPRIPRRGTIGMVALKVYLTLLAGRSNNLASTQLRHTVLRAKTGAQATDLRKAISILANEGLVHVNKEDTGLFSDSDEITWPAQTYVLSGDLTDRTGRG